MNRAMAGEMTREVDSGRRMDGTLHPRVRIVDSILMTGGPPVQGF